VAQTVSGPLDYFGGAGRGPVDQLVRARPEGKNDVGDEADGQDHCAREAGDPQERSLVPSLVEVLAENRPRLGMTANPQIA
jgi:hypothetical protein